VIVPAISSAFEEQAASSLFRVLMQVAVVAAWDVTASPSQFMPKMAETEMTAMPTTLVTMEVFGVVVKDGRGVARVVIADMMGSCLGIGHRSL
jgi:hypothetical protein